MPVDQPRLFTLGVEALQVTVLHRPNRGWSVSVSARRQGDAWGDEQTRRYESLSRGELADVIGSELERILGL